MKLTIGNYRIVKKNSLNLEIEKKEQAKLSRNPEIAAKQLEKGLEEKWNDGYGFYGNLEQACIKVLNLMIHESDAQSVEEMLIAIGEAKAEIVEAINSIDCTELFATSQQEETTEEE